MMTVPFVDLRAQYLTIKQEIDVAISDTIAQMNFVGGNPVNRFEKSFAEFLDIKHVVGVGNGTDSLEIIMTAYGIGVGDEVIVPAHTWISTSETVSAVGATPVFVDTLPDAYTIDTTKIKAAITSKTKAIIPVHLCGLPADMDEIMQIASKHNLIVIEDCAQSHGSFYKGRMTGTIGHASSFSFYPGKNLGAYGDAGGIATNDDSIADACGVIANHGQTEKHKHVREGRNSRLDGMQANILSVKLAYLSRWTKQRQDNAQRYVDKLRGVKGIKLPVCPPDRTHAFHLFMIQIERREEIIKKLKDHGIHTGIHYPKALPFVDCYIGKHNLGDFPVSANYQDKILSLPMYAELTGEQIDYVVKVLLSIV